MTVSQSIDLETPSQIHKGPAGSMGDKGRTRNMKQSGVDQLGEIKKVRPGPTQTPRKEEPCEPAVSKKEKFLELSKLPLLIVI
jgi:hypothetical protein